MSKFNKTILVTGVSGFVGQHLAREMRDHSCVVIGVGHSKVSSEVNPYLDSYHQCDLTDKAAVAKLPLKDIDVVVNLAGLANVGQSFKQPELYQKVNVGVLANIAKVLRQQKGHARILAISTGAVYDPAGNPPFAETAKLVAKDKTSPYVASKLAMEKAAQTCTEQGLDCVIVRPFNHIGPGQRAGFLLPDLVQQITEAVQTDNHSISVGNLETKRDFTDVRDVARAYGQLALADTLKSNVYNVCSGRAVSGQSILELVQKKLGVTDLVIELDNTKVRPNDPAILYGDYSRIASETGWKPTIPLQQTVNNFIDQFTA